MNASALTCVGEVMSAPLVVVRDHDTIWHAVDRFVVTGLHHLVVLDPDDQLVGILDDRRAFAEWPFDAVGLRNRTIGDLLRSRGSASSIAVARIHPAGTLRQAGRLMSDLRVDALAVVDEFGRAAGILTSCDLIHALVTGPEQRPDSGG